MADTTPTQDPGISNISGLRAQIICNYLFLDFHQSSADTPIANAVQLYPEETGPTNNLRDPWDVVVMGSGGGKMQAVLMTRHPPVTCHVMVIGSERKSVSEALTELLMATIAAFGVRSQLKMGPVDVVVSEHGIVRKRKQDGFLGVM